MRIFNADSPLMEGLSKITDLVILNLVVLVCCLPVITAGAALTGMHYVLLKIVRNEEGYIVRSYFKSFKQNFLQATGMWMIFLAVGILFLLDLRLSGGAAGTAIKLPVVFHAFPLLSRYTNTVLGTLRNAAVLTVASFPRTIAMTVATIAMPLIVWLFKPVLPLLVLLGISGPGYICALLYSPVFEKIEANAKGQDKQGDQAEAEED